MVKAIIFDCFGVLATEAWLPFKSKHFDHDPALFQEASDISSQANRGIIDQQEFMDRIGELSGVPSKEVARVMEGNVPDEKLFAYISELKKNYKIGFLSNIAADRLKQIFTAEQVAMFDSIQLSFESGYVKPQPQAYLLAAQDLGCEPGECVMVDDQERNVTGAREAGMQAVLYSGFDQFKNDLGKILADSKN